MAASRAGILRRTAFAAAIHGAERATTPSPDRKKTLADKIQSAENCPPAMFLTENIPKQVFDIYM